MGQVRGRRTMQAEPQPFDAQIRSGRVREKPHPRRPEERSDAATQCGRARKALRKRRQRDACQEDAGCCKPPLRARNSSTCASAMRASASATAAWASAKSVLRVGQLQRVDVALALAGAGNRRCGLERGRSPAPSTGVANSTKRRDRNERAAEADRQIEIGGCHPYGGRRGGEAAASFLLSERGLTESLRGAVRQIT
jgi:hypothetical protein